jgi:formamidopyrimidine-DNA glycosylase
MPELPEVETMCRGLHPIIGRKIRAIRTPPCACKPISIRPSLAQISRHMAGQTVESISRLGKRVLIETKNWALVLQPKMTGLASLTEVPDPDHVRLCIDLQGAPKLRVQFWDRRGLGTVEMLERSQIESVLIQGKLGPDALQIRADDFWKRLKLTSRPIKVALMDQKLLAGVGNLYASEMLHVCKLHPALPANQLTLQQTKRLHQVMLDILKTAIIYEGSTLADGTYRNSVNDPGSYQNEHRVYDKQGEQCPSCKRESIVRIVQAQRSTFYCPRCQKLKPAG